MEILFYWLYQFLVYFSIGLWIQKILGVKAQRANFIPKTTFLGVAVIGTLLQIISVWYPLNLQCHLVIVSVIALLSIPVYYAAYRTKRLNGMFSAPGLMFSVILFFTAAIISIGYATMPIGPHDTGLYHVQTVELARNYAAIPGIGNLHDRLAFNNSWFLNIAFFSHGPLANQPFLYQNSFIYLILLFYILTGINSRLTAGNVRENIFPLVFLIASLLFFTRNPLFIASISPDTTSYILAYFVITELMLNAKSTVKHRIWPLVFIALFGITIKTSSAIILLLFIPFTVVVFRKHALRALLIAAFLLLVTLVPYSVRGYILSGYVAYPVHFLNFLHPEWKLPLTNAISHMNAIKAWARLPGSDFLSSLSQPLGEWVPRWFAAYRNDPIIQSYANMVYALPFILLGIYSSRGALRHYLLMLIFLMVANAAWFFSAPDPRFAYGTLVAMYAACVAYGILPLSGAFPKRKSRSRRLVFAGLTLFTMVFAVFEMRSHYLRLFTSSTIQIAAYPESNIIFRRNIQGRVFATPSPPGEQCWNWSLVCTPYFDKNIVFRGSGLEQGLRIQQ